MQYRRKQIRKAREILTKLNIVVEGQIKHLLKQTSFMVVDNYILKKDSSYKKCCFKCGKQGHIGSHCKSNWRKRKFRNAENMTSTEVLTNEHKRKYVNTKINGNL